MDLGLIIGIVSLILAFRKEIKDRFKIEISTKRIKLNKFGILEVY